MNTLVRIGSNKLHRYTGRQLMVPIPVVWSTDKELSTKDNVIFYQAPDSGLAITLEPGDMVVRSEKMT